MYPDILTEIIDYDDCSILYVAGRVEYMNLAKLSKNINDIFREGNYNLGVDLSEVDKLSSAAIMALLGAYKRAKANNGKFGLIDTPKRLVESLEKAGFHRFFSFYDTDTEYRASLQ